MNQDLPIHVSSDQQTCEQFPNKTNPNFDQTKKSVSSSKNQFLSTIFETSLVKQRNLSLRKKDDQVANDNNDNTKLKFTISNQYSQFYDPLHDKLFHVKGKRPFYKKVRLYETQSKRLPNKSSKSPAQKQFVQIHQPRNHEHQIEFKLYQEELRKRSIIPGPGAYNISKPFVEPVYQTIQKNENIVLVKFHNVEGTSNFKSGNEKLTAIYDKQKLRNPGPGDYATTVEDIKEIKRQRNKSKLDEYAKKHQNNYKFIFEIFNSQLNPHESIPNYSVKDSSNDTVYNGKPVKIQEMQMNVRKQNELKEEKSRKYLQHKAKNPSFIKDYERKRSISQFEVSNNEDKTHKIFEFKTIDEEAIKQRQDRFKISPQVDEKVWNGDSISEQISSENNKKVQIKKKIQKIIETIPEERAKKDKQLYKKKQHLYKGFGYFDGSEKQKLSTKYNVKLEKKSQTLKKLLQPLPNTARRFQSLEMPESVNFKTSRYNKAQPQNRYHMNMLDILVNQQSGKKQEKPFLPRSRISFMNELGLEKSSYLNSTIQY